MSQPFDVTLKHLLEAHPADCLRLVGITTAAPIDVIDADLATVMAEADKVFRIQEKTPWLLHFELQVGCDPELPRRMLRYNVLLNLRHGLPVHSTAILLRPRADGPAMTGVLRQFRGAEQYLEFHYRTVRIWQIPVDELLAGGLGTLPLAPLAAVTLPEVPAVIRRMQERIHSESTRGDEATMWTATYVLMGLRYEQALTEQLLQGVLAMEESVTYQEIIRRGMARGIAQGMAWRRASPRVGPRAWPRKRNKSCCGWAS